jgi:hypothetical protein
LRKRPSLQINDLEEMCKDAERRTSEYKQDGDRSLLVNQEVDERQVNQNPLFRAGRSNRVWGKTRVPPTQAKKLEENFA